MKRSLALILLFGSLGALAGYNRAQVVTGGVSASPLSEHLKGLTKAGPNDLDPSKPLKFDGESIPVYTEDGKKLRGMELMQAVMSGDFVPEPYIDERKEVKAIVLRKASEEEKKRTQDLQKTMEGKSELVGQPAKPFSVKDLDGNEWSLELLKGKIIVMNFWFVECKPCIAEMPDLNKLVEEYKGRDVVFLGFATNEETRIRSFLEKQKFSYRIVPRSGQVAEAYGVTSFPTHIIVDAASKIVYVTSGLGPTTVSGLKAEIDKLLKGITELP